MSRERTVYERPGSLVRMPKEEPDADTDPHYARYIDQKIDERREK